MNNKFYLIMAASTTHMLAADKILVNNNINTDMVPAPPEFGTVCAIALKVSAFDLEKSKTVLDMAGIRIQGIYEEIPRKLDGLMKKLNANILSGDFLSAIKKVEHGEDLDLSEIVHLLKAETLEEKRVLFAAADNMRKDMVGDRVDIRGAIEFSNYCEKNCIYCGIRRDNNELKRYRMNNDEIITVVRDIKKYGMNTVILQSGEDDWWTKDRLLSIIKDIKSKTGMRITLSVGERPYDEYKAFKEAGANNFLLKIETTNRKIFKSLHPDDDFDYRQSCSKWLRELGYLNGSGNMIGLPGQTVEDIADDIMYFKKMGINMIGIGPFLPARGTPLENHPVGDVDLTLKAIAVTRLVCKNVYIPATTALVSAHPHGQVMALQSGANTIMLVNTPSVYRQSYAIYGNKTPVDIESAKEAIFKAGRQLPKFLEEFEAREKIADDLS